MFGASDAQSVEQNIDRVAVFRREVGENDVLLRRQDRIGAEALAQRAERASELCAARLVEDTPAGHGQAEIKLAVTLLMPAEMVLHAEFGHRPRRFERLAEQPFDLCLGPGFAALGDEI